jgi:hypothetical protein
MTAALEGVSGQQHAPAEIYPRERPGTPCAGGWVGPRAGLEKCGKSRPHRDSIPDRPARSQSRNVGRSRVPSSPASYSIGSRFKFGDCLGTSRFLQGNVEIVAYVMPQAFSSTSCAVHYAILSPLFYSVEPYLLIMSPNKT